MKKTVLVTGGSGFLGRKCIAPLQAREFTVHSVSTHEATNGADHHHICDLFDADAANELLANVRPTYLLHLAWSSTPRTFWTTEDNLRWVSASLLLARQFRAYGGRRMVTAGSCAEYDWRSGRCDESKTPLVPSTLYGVSKHALHSTLSAWGTQYGVSVGWARLFFLYGPNEPPEKLVSAVVRACLEKREAKCTSGVQVRDFQYVDDAAGALVMFLDSEICGAVNVASGTAVSVRDVVYAVADALNSRELVRLGALADPPDPPELTASVDRLRTEVGWTDRYNLDMGVQETIRWWMRP